MSSLWTLDDVRVLGKCVLLRLDLNVPMRDGVVTDATRIVKSLPTIQELLIQDARVVILSHLGRPGGVADPAYSLFPVAQALAKALERPVHFATDCVGPVAQQAVAELHAGSVLVLENLRFHKGEEANDPAFAQALADLGDVYINDAFSVSHRAHASTEGITHLLPACAGRLMEEEVNALTQCLAHPDRPLMAIVAGSKVSTKIGVLRHLVDLVDTLVVGGGIANTFLHAQGIPVGKSLIEPGQESLCQDILDQARLRNCRVLLPRDAQVVASVDHLEGTRCVPISQVHPDEMIFDLGPETTREIIDQIESSRSVLWNGPVGVFEVPPFDQASTRIAKALAAKTGKGHLLSVAGGGDTIALLVQAGVMDSLSYVSTAGGAFLEWLEGRSLPGVRALESGLASTSALGQP